VVLVLLALLIVAQFTLPAIASQRVRDRLEPHGPVQVATVTAFPAIELLWGHASSVTVRMSSYRDTVRRRTHAVAAHPSAAVGPAHRLANLLASTAQTDTLDAHVGVLHVGRLQLQEVVLTKRGDVLRAQALLTDAELRAALPAPFTLRPVTSAGRGLTFRGTVALGFTHLSATARLRPKGGAAVITPDIAGIYPSFLSVTVFRDPRVHVDSVNSTRVKGGWRLSASARLTGS
jgi:hypothetical protein